MNDLIGGDCLVEMARIPDRSIHLVLCDLPYGSTRNGWDSAISLEALWKQYRRVLKPRGVVALTAQSLFTARLITSNEVYHNRKVAEHRAGQKTLFGEAKP